ncbi:bifunctional diaminohydroxyphosphoribosylaminopyrimidine deaminase/5-amino-6-(5-phosphoribosylamino)uracil reductase RibD [Rhizobium sp. 16-449-1b]|uniref:bifunctional diaminohydroxyphosphoribosylaminopyrimidine deaminase/5-amino-6-(5-phosphoribosylamino)uracil reductase RibD n=1 Tax=Rhizobium sp. 16-449-1b TaxID=2819989 RepID=UPI001ADC54F7|nr:bifunctional diaminohydroxyphosphoribosylaminopyrimidine deaminase/5-amino-6-(5-phosphoribosylamino)uracil reductase RibD [Rhizobium sp. 16-449-1b]MBO9193760.1 bifunctional diaminohydroxyphosphoribosylaminopyrimidine deaminase/5-amino-6-(5-phosphoribosylamino)uracil reductase RibD [Rhizobium sp. 16-449-1b]
MSASSDDAQFMQEAIRLGLLHLGQTSTNPSVGCVVVRDGRIVGRGTTAVGGRPHAEPQALAEAGELARGATAYVTLEPCSHHGKTPPCADALIASGVSRVVISVTDPDERVSGRGISMLRDAGITVETRLLEEEGRHSLAAYLTRQTKNRPYVILKLAISQDGMIGRMGEGQIAITGPAARAEVQQLRAETDAILVGIGTAVADDPELTVRIPGLEGRSPVRVVLDPLLELPLTSKLVRTARQVPVIVVGREEVSEAWEQDLPPSVLPDISPTRGEIDSRQASVQNVEGGTSGRPQPISPLVGEMPGRAEGGISIADASNNQLESRRQALESAGVEVVYCHPYHPEQLLPALASRGISSLLVEGGAKTARLFLEAGYVDRILLYQGPGTIGQGGIETPIRKTDIPSDFKHVGTRRVGDDSLDEYEREV